MRLLISFFALAVLLAVAMSDRSGTANSPTEVSASEEETTAPIDRLQNDAITNDDAITSDGVITNDPIPSETTAQETIRAEAAEASLSETEPAAGQILAAADGANNAALTALPRPQTPAFLADLYGPPLQPREAWQVSRRIGRGDRLVDVIIGGGADSRDAYRAVEALKGKVDFRRLQIGEEITLRFDQPNRARPADMLTAVQVRTGFDKVVGVSRGPGKQFSFSEETLETLPLLMYAEGTIDDSLFLAAQRAGLPADVIIELIRIYSFEVDFQREIRPGDRFAVLFDRRLLSGTDEVENGAVRFAELTLRGEDKSYYRFMSPTRGLDDYYGPDGKSARRALMKTPIDGARLSSRFGRRKHPILGYTRMHKGLDFAADTGTPVYAAGDGVVEMAERNGGFGNFIRIRHNGTYKTGYAHLSRYGRGIRKGVRVKQGQIIGYVGMTGLANGPNLHYEVYRNGVQINPQTLRLPTGEQLAGDALDSFAQRRDQINGIRERLLGVDRRLAEMSAPNTQGD